MNLGERVFELLSEADDLEALAGTKGDSFVKLALMSRAQEKRDEATRLNDILLEEAECG